MRPEPGALAPHRLERMADAIVAVEYYMEMLQAGRPDQFNMLESAENCLGSLDQSGKVVTLRSRPAEAAPARSLPSVIESVREMAAASAPVRAARAAAHRRGQR